MGDRQNFSKKFIDSSQICTISLVKTRKVEKVACQITLPFCASVRQYFFVFPMRGVNPLVVNSPDVNFPDVNFPDVNFPDVNCPGVN